MNPKHTEPQHNQASPHAESGCDTGSAARHESLRKHFLAILEEQGRSLTPPETVVLNTFIASENHFTLQELLAKARQKDARVTAELVSEIMHLLCEYKIAHEVRFRGSSLFEHYHLSSHHDHFVCVKCGGVRNFYDPGIENLQAQNARQAGFRPLIHRLEIYGVCARCIEMEDRVHPLGECLTGETVRVVRVLGSSEARKHLAGLGILPGEILSVLGQNPDLKTCMVAVKGTRLALSAEFAARIQVLPIDMAHPDHGNIASFPVPAPPHGAPEGGPGCARGHGWWRHRENPSPSAEKPRESFWFRWRWGTPSKEEDKATHD